MTGTESRYKVSPVVCDYGIYDKDKLVLICSSRSNALLIKKILEKDDLVNKSDYIFDLEDMVAYTMGLEA